MFACAPECGDFSRGSAPNNSLARAIASDFRDVDDRSHRSSVSRITLGVLVRQHRAGRLQDCLADEILRGDQLQAEFLAPHFVLNRAGNLGNPFPPAFASESVRSGDGHGQFS